MRGERVVAKTGKEKERDAKRRERYFAGYGKELRGPGKS
jgi:hypothetical protein